MILLLYQYWLIKKRFALLSLGTKPAVWTAGG
jgi:hypothetical protein